MLETVIAVYYMIVAAMQHEPLYAIAAGLFAIAANWDNMNRKK